MKLMRKLENRSCLLRNLGFLNAAMLLLAAAVTEAEGQCVGVGGFAGGPKLCVQDEDQEAAGAAEVDKILARIQPLHAVALAFQSAPHQADGWAQPPQSGEEASKTDKEGLSEPHGANRMAAETSEAGEHRQTKL